MTVVFELPVVELLCSRMCHDLVSPVSAINNGIELMQEMDGDMAEEAVALVAHSADQAARRLGMFRIAYGAGGNNGSASFDLVRSAAEAFFTGSKISLSWPSEILGRGTSAPTGAAKVLCNLIALADEALIYGGTITVSGSASEDGIKATVAASGRAAGLKPDSQVALNGQVPSADLTPRTVHAFVTGRYAEFFGLQLETQQTGPEEFTLYLS